VPPLCVYVVVAVLWPSAIVLAHWICTDQSWLRATTTASGPWTVLELGAGCGLVGLVAAAHCLGRPCAASTVSPRVLLTDFNVTVLKNLELNVALNDLQDVCTVVGLDFYQQDDSVPGVNHEMDDPTPLCWFDTSGHAHEPVNVVLGADIICCPSDAKAIAQTIRSVLRPGGTAYVVCADAAHRFGVECFVQQCEELSLQVHLRDANEIYDFEQVNYLEQTAGYVEGMSLTLFTIQKPVP
jgi:predicted nicotinamide N-methyase